MTSKLEATPPSSSFIQTTPISTQASPLQQLKGLKIEESAKDLSQFEIAPGIANNEKAGTAFRNALNSEAFRKINEELMTLSNLETPSLLSKNEPSPLLEILKMGTQEISESKQLVVNHFKNSKVADPFHFENNLKFLIRHNEIDKAINLLHLQDHLMGFSTIQTISQDIFCNLEPTKDKNTRLERYFEFVEDVLAKESCEEKRLEMALQTYSYFSFKPKIASALERKYFLGKATTSFERILENNEQLKKNCQLSLNSRIRTYLQDSEIKPGPICTLLQFLSKISSETLFIKKSLVALIKRCDHPEKVSIAIKKIKELLPKEIQQECFSGLLEEGIENLLLPFLDIASDENKMALARKFMHLKTHADLFHSSLNAICDLKQAFKDSSPWNVKSLESCFDAFSEKEKIAEILILHISNSEFCTVDGMAFIRKLFPYLSLSAKETLCDRCWKLISPLLQANRPITDFLPLITLMMGSTREPLLFHPEKQGSVKQEFVSFFIHHLEKFNKLLVDKRTDSITETHRKNVQLIIEQVKAYGIPLMSESQKIQLLVKGCESLDPQITSLIQSAIAEISDFNRLKDYKWDAKKLTKGFALFSLHPHKEKYETFALEQVQNSPIFIYTHFLPYLSKESKEKSILECVELFKKTKDQELYISSILQIEDSFFIENPKIYIAFLNITSRYLSSKENPDFLSKIQRIIPKAEVLIPQFKEKDLYTHQLGSFIYANSLRDLDLASKQVMDCSDSFIENFSRVTSQWDFSFRTAFMSGLLQREFFEDTQELFLNSLYHQLVALEKDSVSFSIKILDFLASRITMWGSLYPNLESQCSYLLRKILLKENTEKNKQIAFELLQKVHIDRLKKEGMNPNTELDLQAYLEFLQGLDVGVRIEEFINEHDLYKENPVFLNLIKIYDTDPDIALYSHKNLVKDFELLQERSLPTSSPQNMLFALCLNFRTGKSSLKAVLESIMDQLRSTFTNKPFLFCETLRSFYQIIYTRATFLVYEKGNFTDWISLQSTARLFIEKCREECLLASRLTTTNQVTILADLFHQLYILYLRTSLNRVEANTQPFGEHSISINNENQQLGLQCKDVCLVILSKLTEYKGNFIEILIELVKEKQTIENAPIIALQRKKVLTMNLEFFKSLIPSFPESTKLKEYVQEQESIVLELSGETF